MYSAVGKAVAMGAGCGSVAAVSCVKPKTQNGEHLQNKFTTVAGLGALAAAPYGVKYLIKNNPETAAKVFEKTGSFIEKAAKYTADKAPKLYEKIAKSKAGQKAAEYIKKGKTSSFGQKLTKYVAETFSKVKTYVAKNKTISNAATKIANAAEKFVKAPTAAKGKYALLAAGVGLLAYTAFKGITNYYKKEGAIDQKYKDIEIMSKLV